jgi:hypothetical protein
MISSCHTSWHLMTTPGWMVRVTPALTMTLHVRGHLLGSLLSVNAEQPPRDGIGEICNTIPSLVRSLI